MQVNRGNNHTVPPSDDDNSPVPSVRLSSRIERAAAQTTSPFAMRHSAATAMATAQPMRGWIAGGPLPRVTRPGDVNPAPDPALHEMRVGSLDSGLQWIDTPQDLVTAAARSAPASLAQPPTAAGLEAAASPHSTSSTSQHVMQGLRAQAERRQRQTDAAVAAAQLASRIAAAAAIAQAGADVTLEHVFGAVMAAASAASVAASVAVLAAFSPDYSLSPDSSVKTSEYSGSLTNDSDMGLTFSLLARGMGAPPTQRGMDFKPRAGVLFPGSQQPDGCTPSPFTGLDIPLTGTQTQAPLTSPLLSASGISAAMGSQPDPPATSALPILEDGDDGGSPAVTLNSDKENMSPLKPAATATVSGASPSRTALVRMRLGDPSGPMSHAAPDHATQIALPSRVARDEPQVAVPAWQVNSCYVRPKWSLCSASTIDRLRMLSYGCDGHSSVVLRAAYP